MSAPTARRRRRGQHDTPEAARVPDQGANVTSNPQPQNVAPIVRLEDPESANFLLYRLHAMTGKAREAYERAGAAAARAAGHEQTSTKLEAAKQQVLAQLAEIEREEAAAQHSIKEAEAERDGHMAEHEKHVRLAEDASRLCRAAGISTDSGLPVPPTGPFPAQPVDPTSDDPRMEGPLRRWNQAHDEHDAETGEQAAAS